MVCLFVCLFNRSLCAETRLGPDGTKHEQNAQARLSKPVCDVIKQNESEVEKKSFPVF